MPEKMTFKIQTFYFYFRGKSNDPYNEFNEVTAKKPFEPPMVGPIYPHIDTTNQFNPKIEKTKGPVDRMAGPIYEGIEIHNQFNQVDERVRGDIVMVWIPEKDLKYIYIFKRTV